MKKKIKISLCALAGAAVLAVAPMQAAVRAGADSRQGLYDLQEILTPVWEGNTCYQESVLPVAMAQGDVSVPLLYPIENVLEIKNAELTVTYQEGVDYSVANGELVIHGQGDIYIMPYMEFSPVWSDFKNVTDGGYLCFSEGSYFHKRQIVVTYTHKTKYSGYAPENKGDLLPNLHQNKLKSGENLDVFVLGDSISAGANSSGFSEISVSPYMPIYPQLFADGLREQYGLQQVNVYNHAVGGKNSAWGAAQIENALSQHKNVDLAVLAFGMNDGDLTPSAFNLNLLQMIEAVQTKFPSAEILLVATMVPNPKSEYNQNQAYFAELMQTDLEREGVAVVNMTALHESLLLYKNYADMTGNNINHPNDYLARVYAQALLATVQKKTDGQPNENIGGCANAIECAVGTPLVLALAFALKERKACK